MTEVAIPEQSHLRQYLPADYADIYSVEVAAGCDVTPDELFDQTFNDLPGWVQAMLSLRDWLVRPLGLKGGTHFADCVSERNEHEVIFGLADKHLTFHGSLWCESPTAQGQRLSIITVVTYHNRTGRIYFALIRPFHGWIVRALLRRVGKRINALHETR